MKAFVFFAAIFTTAFSSFVVPAVFIICPAQMDFLLEPE
jgi:hypothetical protein